MFVCPSICVLRFVVWFESSKLVIPGHVRYEQITKNYAFWDAQAACTVQGGNLVTIKSDKENDLIR